MDSLVMKVLGVVFILALCTVVIVGGLMPSIRDKGADVNNQISTQSVSDWK